MTNNVQAVGGKALAICEISFKVAKAVSKGFCFLQALASKTFRTISVLLASFTVAPDPANVLSSTTAIIPITPIILEITITFFS